MTDGILLAETQGDPLLRAYDTLIIDEAHERSLNIDFLLGYLRAAPAAPARPEGHRHLGDDRCRALRRSTSPARDGPAPVIEVSGRLYPGRACAGGRSRRAASYDLNDAIGDAVDELWRDGAGDVLVFLPGEREIRDAAEHLRKHHPPGVEILPLFARLSQQEQERVFEPHGRARASCWRPTSPRPR